VDQRAEQFLLEVFDSATDPLAVFDLEYRIFKVNKAMSALFKVPPEELIGRRCYEVFIGREAPCEGCHAKGVFASGEPCTQKVDISPPSGMAQSFDVLCYPIRDSEGRTIRVIQHMRQAAGMLRRLVFYDADADKAGAPRPGRSSYGEIIGRSRIMQEVYELIDLVSKSDATVLITGENGTGKELVAQAIHNKSGRRRGPFVVANCSAYSPTLLESELFGHEMGAFTGAIRQKKGRIERANGGTLFLDEIGDIAPATQVLLLRFLQDHIFERVGGESTIKADVRVLAATNRNLSKELDAGKFREDLYYRLNVITIHLPRLCERREDIPPLSEHFLERFNEKEKKEIKRFSSNAMKELMRYEWPGNVRQLENAISHAVIMTKGSVITRKQLPRFLQETLEESTTTSLSENERRLILKVLEESNWNKHEAARRLKVSRSTLYSKIRRYGLEERRKSV
jgi:transcriptional regulator with PAS, ATPase and Fis domain